MDKYEEALEKARQLCVLPTDRAILEEIFPELRVSEDERIRKEMIEIIKNEAHEFPASVIANKSNSWIAWLEKQGEHANFINNIQVGDKVTRNKDGVLINLSQLNRVAKKQGENSMGISEATKQKLEENLNKALEKETPESWNEFLDEQDEKPQGKSALEAIKEVKVDNQNCVKPDKVEPKFHEGEWLCENEPNNYARFIQILETVNVQGKERYRISRDIHNDEDIVEFNFVEKYYHKFDIKDAKDGDVLANNGNIILFKQISDSARPDYKFIQSYCFVLTHSFDFYLSGTYNLDDGFHPAIKEQRDLLFQKMKEAGYEWDAEKKELKKIEQNLAWSEEDETMITDLSVIVHTYFSEISGIPFKYDLSEDKIRTWLKSLKDRVQPKPMQEWSEEDEKKRKRIMHRLGIDGTINNKDLADINDWLKSLRPQNTWKPSDKQLDALHDAAVYVDKSMFPYPKGILMKLYEQLKKLREE